MKKTLLLSALLASVASFAGATTGSVESNFDTKISAKSGETVTNADANVAFNGDITITGTGLSLGAKVKNASKFKDFAINDSTLRNDGNSVWVKFVSPEFLKTVSTTNLIVKFDNEKADYGNGTIVEADEPTTQITEAIDSIDKVQTAKLYDLVNTPNKEITTKSEFKTAKDAKEKEKKAYTSIDLNQSFDSTFGALKTSLYYNTNFKVYDADKSYKINSVIGASGMIDVAMFKKSKLAVETKTDYKSLKYVKGTLSTTVDAIEYTTLDGEFGIRFNPVSYAKTKEDIYKEVIKNKAKELKDGLTDDRDLYAQQKDAIDKKLSVADDKAYIFDSYKGTITYKGVENTVLTTNLKLSHGLFNEVSYKMVDSKINRTHTTRHEVLPQVEVKAVYTNDGLTLDGKMNIDTLIKLSDSKTVATADNTLATLETAFNEDAKASASSSVDVLTYAEGNAKYVYTPVSQFSLIPSAMISVKAHSAGNVNKFVLLGGQVKLETPIKPTDKVTITPEFTANVKSLYANIDHFANDVYDNLLKNITVLTLTPKLSVSYSPVSELSLGANLASNVIYGSRRVSTDAGNTTNKAFSYDKFDLTAGLSIKYTW